MPLAHEQYLIDKIRELPPNRIAEVEDFVDFLKQKELDSSSLKSKSDNSSLDFPVDDTGSWPENLSLQREDIYNDDGR